MSRELCLRNLNTEFKDIRIHNRFNLDNIMDIAYNCIVLSKHNKDILGDLNTRHDTAEHCLDVGMTVARLSSELSLNNNINLIAGGLLHDIGKLLIKQSIIDKPSKLSKAEMGEIKLHSFIGCALLRMRYPKANEDIYNSILYHHSGSKDICYPKEADNNIINKEGVMVVKASDIICALLTNRSYKKSFSKLDSYKILTDSDIPGYIIEEVFKIFNQII